MSFRRPESRVAVERFNAGATAAGAAAPAGTASLDCGTAPEELAGDAPVPNCPARKTCAAVASLDLMSCAGAVFDAAGDVAAGDAAVEAVVGADAVDAEVAGVETTGDAARALPAAAAPVMRTFTAKFPVQSSAGDALTPVFTPKKRWPGASALSREWPPTARAVPCSCSRAIRDPAGAAATGRLELA